VVGYSVFGSAAFILDGCRIGRREGLVKSGGWVLLKVGIRE